MREKSYQNLIFTVWGETTELYDYQEEEILDISEQDSETELILTEDYEVSGEDELLIDDESESLEEEILEDEGEDVQETLSEEDESITDPVG